MNLNSKQVNFIKVLKKTQKIFNKNFKFYGHSALSDTRLMVNNTVFVDENNVVCSDRGFYIHVIEKSKTPFKDVTELLSIDKSDFSVTIASPTYTKQKEDSDYLGDYKVIYDGVCKNLDETHTQPTLIDREKLLNFLNNNDKFDYASVIKDKIITGNWYYNELKKDININSVFDINLGYNEEPKVIVEKVKRNNPLMNNDMVTVTTCTNSFTFDIPTMISVLKMFPKNEKVYIRMPLAYTGLCNMIIIESENYGKFMLMVRKGFVNYQIVTRNEAINNILDGKYFHTYNDIKNALFDAVTELGYNLDMLVPTFYDADIDKVRDYIFNGARIEIENKYL